ncbi:MAG TPA: isoprenylcysteine carboxylmethyltransferase family protein [Myxococcota bacterium]|nr:isoprenylcysteine carboxylmethyltransferase family protein [Myxococcota bacterium]
MAALIAAAVLPGSVLLFAGLIFAPAGRLDWIAGWLCLAIMVIGFSAVTAHVALRTPSLIRRRAKPGAGTPRWDLAFVSFFQLSFAAILVVGGLDAGRHPAHALSATWQGLGAASMAFAMLGLGWAMGANPHFEATVRIQSDQHHRVVDRGPYRIVRHPGYAAGIPLLFAMALVLGSRWALVPALLGAIALIARAALEDEFLTDRLDGYRAYAERTPFRLLPGVW